MKGPPYRRELGFRPKRPVVDLRVGLTARDRLRNLQVYESHGIFVGGVLRRNLMRVRGVKSYKETDDGME
jgi:hypothetical protein